MTILLSGLSKSVRESKLSGANNNTNDHTVASKTGGNATRKPESASDFWETYHAIHVMEYKPFDYTQVLKVKNEKVKDPSYSFKFSALLNGFQYTADGREGGCYNSVCNKLKCWRKASSIIKALNEKKMGIIFVSRDFMTLGTAHAISKYRTTSHWLLIDECDAHLQFVHGKLTLHKSKFDFVFDSSVDFWGKKKSEVSANKKERKKQAYKPKTDNIVFPASVARQPGIFDKPVKLADKPAPPPEKTVIPGPQREAKQQQNNNNNKPKRSLGKTKAPREVYFTANYWCYSLLVDDFSEGSLIVCADNSSRSGQRLFCRAKMSKLPRITHFKMCDVVQKERPVDSSHCHNNFSTHKWGEYRILDLANSHWLNTIGPFAWGSARIGREVVYFIYCNPQSLGNASSIGICEIDDRYVDFKKNFNYSKLIEIQKAAEMEYQAVELAKAAEEVVVNDKVIIINNNKEKPSDNGSVGENPKLPPEGEVEDKISPFSHYTIERDIPAVDMEISPEEVEVKLEVEEGDLELELENNEETTCEETYIPYEPSSEQIISLKPEVNFLFNKKVSQKPKQKVAFATELHDLDVYSKITVHNAKVAVHKGASAVASGVSTFATTLESSIESANKQVTKVGDVVLSSLAKTLADVDAFFARCEAELNTPKSYHSINSSPGDIELIDFLSSSEEDFSDDEDVSDDDSETEEERRAWDEIANRHSSRREADPDRAVEPPVDGGEIHLEEVHPLVGDGPVGGGDAHPIEPAGDGEIHHPLAPPPLEVVVPPVGDGVIHPIPALPIVAVPPPVGDGVHHPIPPVGAPVPAPVIPGVVFPPIVPPAVVPAPVPAPVIPGVAPPAVVPVPVVPAPVPVIPAPVPLAPAPGPPGLVPRPPRVHGHRGGRAGHATPPIYEHYVVDSRGYRIKATLHAVPAANPVQPDHRPIQIAFNDPVLEGWVTYVHYEWVDKRGVAEKMADFRNFHGRRHANDDLLYRLGGKYVVKFFDALLPNFGTREVLRRRVDVQAVVQIMNGQAMSYALTPEQRKIMLDRLSTKMTAINRMPDQNVAFVNDNINNNEVELAQFIYTAAEEARNKQNVVMMKNARVNTLNSLFPERYSSVTDRKTPL